MFGTMKDVYVAQERYADYRADAEMHRMLHGKPQAGPQVWPKIWRQMQNWRWMLRRGTGRAGVLQNRPQ